MSMPKQMTTWTALAAETQSSAEGRRAVIFEGLLCGPPPASAPLRLGVRFAVLRGSARP